MSDADKVACSNANEVVLVGGYASDPEGNAMTYALATPSDKFVLNTATGELAIAAENKLNYESSTTEVVNIRVSDIADNFLDVRVTVNVVNVNEPAVLFWDNVDKAFVDRLLKGYSSPPPPLGDVADGTSFFKVNEGDVPQANLGTFVVCDLDYVEETTEASSKMSITVTCLNCLDSESALFDFDWESKSADASGDLCGTTESFRLKTTQTFPSTQSMNGDAVTGQATREGQGGGAWEGHFILSISVVDEKQDGALGDALTRTQEITVEVINNNFAPVGLPSAVTISERQDTSVFATATFTDQDGIAGDGSTNPDTHTCTLDSPQNAGIQVNPDCTIQLVTPLSVCKEKCSSESPVCPHFDFECADGIPSTWTGSLTSPVTTIKVQVKDQADAVSTTLAEITVTISDVDESPFFESPSTRRFALNETRAPNTEIGTVIAKDVDTSPVTYALDTVHTHFQIDPTSGVISLISALDFETQTFFSFNVVASSGPEGNAETARMPVVVDVIDVDETPIIANKTGVLDGNGNPTFTVSEAALVATSSADGAFRYKLGEVLVTDDKAFSGMLVTEGGNQFAVLKIAATGVVCDPAVFNASCPFRVIPNARDVTQAEARGDTHVTFDLEMWTDNAEFTLPDRLVDYEHAKQIQLQMVVKDESGNEVTSTFVVAITDATDITVATVTPQVSGNLNTVGNETVELHGTNFGTVWDANPISYTYAVDCFDVNGDPIQNCWSVSYGTYDAAAKTISNPLTPTLCTRVFGNTKISCTTVAGIGGNHRWQVSFNNPTGVSVAAASPADQTTSYSPPDITSVTVVSTVDMAASGGSVVQIVGTNFGSQADLLNIRIQQPWMATAASFQGQSPDSPCTDESCYGIRCSNAAFDGAPGAVSTVRCEVPAGHGGNVTWRMTVDGSSSNWTTAAARYNKPSITDVNATTTTVASTFLTSGEQVIRVQGSEFGISSDGNRRRDGAEPLLSYTGSAGATIFVATQCTVGSGLADDTGSVIECRTAKGVGKDLAWTLTIAGESTDAFASSLKYEGPSVALVSGNGFSNSPTLGGADIQIDGTSFGPVGTIANVTYGPTGTEFTVATGSCTVDFDDVRLRCQTGVGTGKDHSWMVTVGGQASVLFHPSPVGSSYGAPVLYNLLGADNRIVNMANTEGGEVVVLSGQNYGAQEDRISSSVNLTRNSISYGPCTDTVTDPNSGLVECARRLYNAEDCSVKSHTRIECKTVSGGGANQKWLIIVDGQRSSSASTSYAPPSIASLEGVGIEARTMGSDVVTLVGENFGTTETMQYVEYRNDMGQTYRVPAGSNVLKNITHDKIELEMLPGFGRNIKWIVRVGPTVPAGCDVRNVSICEDYGITSSDSTQGTKYADPEVNIYTPNIELDTEGAQVIVVNGTNFAHGTAAVVTITMTQHDLRPITITPTTHTIAASSEQLTFSMPPACYRDECATAVGSAYPAASWTLTVGGVVSQIYPMAYGLPVITKIALVEVGDEVTATVTGRNFGCNGVASASGGISVPCGGQVMLKGSAAATVLGVAVTSASVLSWSHTEVVFTISGASGGFATIKLGPVESVAFAYDNVGPQVLEMLNTNPVSWDFQSVLTKSYYRTKITSGIDAGKFVEARIAPANAGTIGDLALNPLAFPSTEGGSIIQVEGKYFTSNTTIFVGQFKPDANWNSVKTPCVVVSFIHQDDYRPVHNPLKEDDFVGRRSLIECVVPAGQGALQGIEAVDNNKTSPTVTFNYAKPTIATVTMSKGTAAVKLPFDTATQSATGRAGDSVIATSDRDGEVAVAGTHFGMASSATGRFRITYNTSAYVPKYPEASGISTCGVATAPAASQVSPVFVDIGMTGVVASASSAVAATPPGLGKGHSLQFGIANPNPGSGSSSEYGCFMWSNPVKLDFAPPNIKDIDTDDNAPDSAEGDQAIILYGDNFAVSDALGDGTTIVEDVAGDVNLRNPLQVQMRSSDISSGNAWVTCRIRGVRAVVPTVVGRRLTERRLTGLGGAANATTANECAIACMAQPGCFALTFQDGVCVFVLSPTPHPTAHPTASPTGGSYGSYSPAVTPAPEPEFVDQAPRFAIETYACAGNLVNRGLNRPQATDMAFKVTVSDQSGQYSAPIIANVCAAQSGVQSCAVPGVSRMAEALDTAGGTVLTVTGSQFKAGVSNVLFGYGTGPCAGEAACLAKQCFQGTSSLAADLQFQWYGDRCWRKCIPTGDEPISPETITCAAPMGQGLNQALFVTNGAKKIALSSSEIMLDYKPPVVTSVLWGAPMGLNNTKTTGATVTVEGTNLGFFAMIQLSYGGVYPENYTAPADATMHSSVEFLIPAGEGIQHGAILNVSGQMSNPGRFSYGAPSVTGWTIENGTCGETIGFDHRTPLSTAPPQIVTVVGSNFGKVGGKGYTAGTSHNVYVGGRKCEEIVRDYNSVTCYLPPGQGREVDLTVCTFGTQCSTTGQFDYCPPTVTEIRINGTALDSLTAEEIEAALRFPTDGKAQVTFVGRNFGGEDYSFVGINANQPGLPGGSVGGVTLSVGGGLQGKQIYPYSAHGDEGVVVSPSCAQSPSECGQVIFGANNEKYTTEPLAKFTIPQDVGLGGKRTLILSVASMQADVDGTPRGKAQEWSLASLDACNDGIGNVTDSNGITQYYPKSKCFVQYAKPIATSSAPATISTLVERYPSAENILTITGSNFGYANKLSPTAADATRRVSCDKILDNGFEDLDCISTVQVRIFSHFVKTTPTMERYANRTSYENLQALSANVLPGEGACTEAANCKVCAIKTHTQNQITCLPGAGIGANLSFVVLRKPPSVLLPVTNVLADACSQEARRVSDSLCAQSVPFQFSYSKPEVLEIRQGYVDAMRGDTVTVVGNHFGVTGTFAQLSILQVDPLVETERALSGVSGPVPRIVAPCQWLPQASSDGIRQVSFLTCIVPPSRSAALSDLAAGRKHYQLEVALQVTDYHNIETFDTDDFKACAIGNFTWNSTAHSCCVWNSTAGVCNSQVGTMTADADDRNGAACEDTPAAQVAAMTQNLYADCTAAQAAGMCSDASFATVMQQLCPLSCDSCPKSSMTTADDMALAAAMVTFKESRSILKARCKKGYFGNSNLDLGTLESCVPCPAGASCDWEPRKGTEGQIDPVTGTVCNAPNAFGLYVNDRCYPSDVRGVQPSDITTPSALTGWWMSPATAADCVQKQRTTAGGAISDTATVATFKDAAGDDFVLATSCTKWVPCEPADACLGSNTCQQQYSGVRCSDCADRYYKLAGECIQCPDCPACIAIVFLLFGIGCGVAGYILTRKKINLAVLSIGVDYFQVLAILGQSNRIEWPPEVRQLYNSMSVFNLNLDLMAPECSFPSMAYEDKWSIIQMLPVGSIFIFICVHFAKWGHKKFVLKRTKKLHNHRHLVIGTSLSAFYYLYLYITKTSLDIFNCSATEPPEGDPPIQYLEVVFVPCYQPGGLHMRMLPQATLTFLAYTVGYPMLVAFILLKNSERVKEDQLLRARDTGTSRATNPNCHDFRKRFSRLYYQFKPHHYYWILVILCRKFFIATSGLLFRKYPVFLLAFMLLIMFSSYAMQVRHQPYMSMAERAMVVAKYEAEIAGLDTHVVTAKARAADKRKGKKNIKFGDKSARSAVAKQSADYLMNYNTVECVLLFCACMVLLCGLMFQSKQVTPGSSVLLTLTSCTLAIMVSSICYFFFVVFHEIVTGLGLKQKKKGGADEKSDAKEEEEEEDDGAMVFADNAILAKNGTQNPLAGPEAGKGGASAKELSDAMESIQQLQSEVKDLKKKLQANALQSYNSGSSKKVRGGTAAGGHAHSKRGEKTKKAFGQSQGHSAIATEPEVPEADQMEAI
jgi:hypothetical protein